MRIFDNPLKRERLIWESNPKIRAKYSSFRDYARNRFVKVYYSSWALAFALFLVGGVSNQTPVIALGVLCFPFLGLYAYVKMSAIGRLPQVDEPPKLIATSDDESGDGEPFGFNM